MPTTTPHISNLRAIFFPSLLRIPRLPATNTRANEAATRDLSNQMLRLDRKSAIFRRNALATINRAGRLQ